MNKEKENMLEMVPLFMRSCLAFTFLFFSSQAFSQADSLQVSLLDSVNNLASMQWVKDSLTINSWADNMKMKVQGRFNTDSITLKTKVDSLLSLNLSPEPYVSQMDSLLNVKSRMLTEVNSGQQKLLSTTSSKISEWKQKVQGRMDSLGIKAAMPDANLPGMKELSLPELNVPEMPALTAPDFAELNLSPDLSILNQNLDFASPEGLKVIQDNLSGITEHVSGLKNLKGNLGENVESSLSEIGAVSEIQKQSEALKALKPPENPMEQLPDVKEQGMEQAVDHFAGKEEQLNQTMEKVSKYKQKYSHVESLNDLRKKPPNPMKEKPFIERLVPGIALQYQRMNDYLLDMNVYSGYRFTQRLTAGFGWNYRVARDENNEYWKHQSYIFGPRTFANYTLGKGFIAHLEVESMNTFVPVSFTDPNTGQREWVWGMTIGMKKTYKLTNFMKGTILALYNIFDPHNKSPYMDRLNMRVGVEFLIKKKRKQS